MTKRQARYEAAARELQAVSRLDDQGNRKSDWRYELDKLAAEMRARAFLQRTRLPKSFVEKMEAVR